MNKNTLTQLQVYDVTDNTAAHSPIVINAKTLANTNEDNQHYAIINLAAVSIGSNITFNLDFPTTYKIVFTCTNTNSANTFALKPVGSISTVSDRIAQLINDNPVLSSLYTCYVNRGSTGLQNQIYIISKQPGSNFNLNGKITTTTTANIVYGSFDTPVSIGSGQSINDLYLFCDIRVASAKSSITVLPQAHEYFNTQSLRLPFNKFDNHYFDLSEYLKNFVSTPKPLTVSNNTMQELQNITSAMCFYSIDLGYIYSRDNNIPIKQTFYTLSNLKTFNAALPVGTSNNFDRYVKGVNAVGSLSPVQFLTTKKSSVLKKNGFNVLYFWLANTTTITLKYFIEFTDGSRTAVQGQYATYQTVNTITNAQPKLYYIMHKIDEFVLSQERINNKNASSYFVVVVNNINQVVVTERQIKLDDKFYDYQVDLLYQNSLGGYESVQFTGRNEKRPERTFTQYIASDAITYKTGDTYQGVKDVEFVNSYTLKSGYFKFKDLEDLTELLKSTSVYRINRISGNFESIQITGSDYLAKDGSDLYQLSITVLDTIAETNINK